MLRQSKVAPMEILLVEDGLTDARVTIFAIRRSRVHHRLSLVRTVHDAKRFLGRETIFGQAPRINLLLLDLMLPDGTGLDLLQTIRDHDELVLPTTVVLTASPDETMERKCRELGAIDFMKKPVREDDFMRVVRDHKRHMVEDVAAAV